VIVTKTNTWEINPNVKRPIVARGHRDSFFEIDAAELSGLEWASASEIVARV
jgi:hypothetical protein